MLLYQLIFVVNYIYVYTFLVTWLPVASVLLDSIRLKYCFYDISFIIFYQKWRCPYVIIIALSDFYTML